MRVISFEAKQGCFGEYGWVGVPFFKWLHLHLDGYVTRVRVFSKNRWYAEVPWKRR